MCLTFSNRDRLPTCFVDNLTSRSKARLKAGYFQPRLMAIEQVISGGWMTTGRLSGASLAPRGEQARDSNIAERIVMMCGSAVFTGLTESECLEIASCARARTFARDELLFMQGQPTGSLVMLHGGSVKHTKISTDGNEVILYMSGKCEPIGIPVDPVSAATHAQREPWSNARRPSGNTQGSRIFWQNTHRLE